MVHVLDAAMRDALAPRDAARGGFAMR